MKMLRFWTTCLLLTGTALLIHLRDGTEVHAASEPLSGFPKKIGAWVGSNQQIDAETLEVLGAGDFLSRIYTQNHISEPISLFIGYFPTQRTGTTIHSPKNCLPGNGWEFESSSTVILRGVDGKSNQIGEYVIAHGENRQFAIYWYQAHGRSVANEYLAKLYLVSDAIRMNRTDGALVRVITPIQASDEVLTAKRRAEDFVRQLFPSLPQFIPN